MGFQTLNDAATALASNLASSSATSATVATGDGALFAGASTISPFRCGLFDATTGALKEIIDVTGRSTDTLTIVRTVEDATRFPASAWASGTVLAVVDTVSMIPVDSPRSNPLTKTFFATGYGAKANAVTRADGAMTNASATLTAAGASFTAADVGKTVVVNNALGAGSHLYTTISAFTDATHVTLAANATATISGATFTYGTDDTTAVQAAITAAQAVHGTVQLPATPTLITSALSVTDGVRLVGSGSLTTSGHLSATDVTPANIPLDAPYLTGSVLVQAGANANGITILCSAGGRSVDLRDFGIYFAGMFKTTGHGVLLDAATLNTYKDLGLEDFRWDNLHVYGHDGTHYGYWLTNPLLGTLSHLMAWGGGGIAVEGNNPVCNMGNLVIVHPFSSRVCGAVHGYFFKPTNGTVNLIALIRPQTISGLLNVDHFTAAFGSMAQGGAAMSMAAGVSQVTVVAPDFEYGLVTGAPGAPNVIGDGFFTMSGLLDAAPYGQVRNSRRLNRDFSQSLDAAEGAGTVWWLLNDIPQGATWGLTTDGTVRFQIPGTFKISGKGPTTATGAGSGTTPPPVVTQGTDLAGRAIFGTGTSPAAGNVAVFTFSRTYATAPNVLLTANNSATQALGLYVAAVSTTGFTVAAANAPSASQSVSTYDFSYMAMDSGGAPAPPVIWDDFNRTDNTSVVGSPQVGSAPTVLSGTWGINTNRLYNSAGGGILYWEASKADATWQGTYAALGTSTQDGMCYRLVDANNYWIVTGDGHVYKNVAGSFTSLATFTSLSAGDIIKVVTSGSTHTVFKNGTQVATFTDASLSTATKVGAREQSSSAFRLDNLQVF